MDAKPIPSEIEENCLKSILVVFRLLANTEPKKCLEANSDTANTNSFDELLMQNLSYLGQALASDGRLRGLENIRRWLSEDFEDTWCVWSHKQNVDSKRSWKQSPVSSVDVCEEERVELVIPELRTSCPSDGISLNSRAIRWTFLHVCLCSLDTLRIALKHSENSESPVNRAGIELLSVSDQKVVSTIIQMIVILGICPNLLPGVGIPVEQRSAFSHVLSLRSTSQRCPKCLFECTMTLVKCMAEPSLSVRILSRHLVDVLSSLLQLGYSCETSCDKTGTRTECCSDNTERLSKDVKITNEIPSKYDHDQTRDYKGNMCDGGVGISQGEQEECISALKNIIDKVYQPLVVRGLLFLQGSVMGSKPGKRNIQKGGSFLEVSKSLPCDVKKKSDSATSLAWMQEACGHLLSKCLMNKNGVQNVLRGVLEGVAGTSVEFEVCEAISQLIASCPLQVQTPDDYYKSISPQVLALLHLPNLKLRQQYSRVSVQIIHAMMRRYPDLAVEYVTNPLAKPFYLATETTDCLKQSSVLINEKELTQCIEDMHKVFVASPDSGGLVIRNTASILVSLFDLFCFTRDGVSHVRTAVQELISAFFKRLKEQDALIMLYVLAFNELPSEDSFKELMMSGSFSCEECVPNLNVMSSSCTFAYGPGGGVMLVKTDQPGSGSCAKQKYHKNILGKAKDVSESRALCLVDIIGALRRGDVPGNFFLFLLEQVQNIILDSDSGEKLRTRVVMIFQLLALMAEKLGPSVLKNTHQIIAFIHTTLTRAHHVYVERSSREPDMCGFQVETLSLSLGMLSILLSGAVKVENSEYHNFQDLVPILRRISDEHEEQEIREIANDLLVVILTQGTVLSEKNKQVKVTSKRATKDRASSSSSQRTARHDSNSFKFDSANDDPNFTQLQGVGFDRAFELLRDPLLPVRGYALMRLANLLTKRDPKAVEKVDILVKTFQDSLIHNDSYIYLAAIEGLAAAADVRSDDVIPCLAQEFVSFNDSTMAADEKNNTGREMYVGPERENDSSRRPVVTRSSATRMKLGEALLRATKRCGQLVPRYFRCLVQTFLAGVKDQDSFIRASSLSNLGELCSLAPYTIPTVEHEIFQCLNSVLKSDEASEVRRAAVLVWSHVLRGLGKNAVEILAETFKDMYHLLKLVESLDKDETTRIHARVALGELESIMRQQLFPEQQLEKHIDILP